eukprot:3225981-Karenia_brevis.AAC.1
MNYGPSRPVRHRDRDPMHGYTHLGTLRGSRSRLRSRSRSRESFAVRIPPWRRPLANHASTRRLLAAGGATP